MLVGFPSYPLICGKMIEPERIDGGLHKTTAEVGKNASRNGKNAVRDRAQLCLAPSTRLCALLTAVDASCPLRNTELNLFD
jgi:hypothetical protein